MRFASLAAVIVVGAVALIAMMSMYTVHQTQHAIVLQFGAPKEVIETSGLHFKLPWQQVEYLDRRILDLDTPEQEAPASDGERLVVDAFARFRIADPLVFFTAARTETRARQRLSGFLLSSVRDALAAYPRDILFTDERSAFMQRIQDEVSDQAAPLGIEIVDVRIRRTDLPTQNSAAVYQRMRSERVAIAQQIRSEGEAIALRIRSEADRSRTVIIANANRESEIIRGSGDAERARLFNEAFGQDPEFFAFYRSMQAYRGSLTGEGNSFILSPESEYFRYFNDSTGQE